MRREAKKQQMIEAAVRLFSRKSFSEVSMRDIAKEAGVSPALFYKYFDDQQHLYIEAMKIEALKLLDQLASIDNLSELIEEYIRYMFHDDVLYQMMAYFMLEGASKKPSAPPYKEVSKLMKRFEEGLRPLFPEDAKKESQLLFSVLNGLLITYKNYPILTEEQALQQILSLSSRYIRHLELQ